MRAASGWGHSGDKTILVQARLSGPADGHPPLPVTTTTTT